MKIPRKKKKKIPKGTPYCYLPDDKKNSKEKSFKYYYIKPCPFYDHIDGLEGHCKLLKCEVIDQVKECGIKIGF